MVVIKTQRPQWRKISLPTTKGMIAVWLIFPYKGLIKYFQHDPITDEWSYLGTSYVGACYGTKE